MTKGYTIAFFVREIQKMKITAKTLKEKHGVYKALSPRRGYWSLKAILLDVWTQGNVDEIIAGRTARAKKLGKTPKARLLKALANRKKFARRISK